MRGRTIERSGYGFGTKVFRGFSNVPRVLAFAYTRSESGTDRLAVLAFEVDDRSPDDLIIELDTLRTHVWVLELLQLPAAGRKG